MKISITRLLSLVLCAVLVLGLAACGNIAQDGTQKPDGKDEPSAPEATEAVSGSTDYVWKSSFLPVTLEDSDNYLQPALYTDDGFYATYSVKVGRREIPEGEVEEYEGQYDIYGTMLCFVDKNGKVEKLPNYNPAEPEADTEGRKDFYSYCNLGRPVLTADGKLMALEQHGCGWFDGPEDVYGTEAQWQGDYYRNKQSMDIVTFGTDGTELSRATVDIDLENTWVNSNTVALAPDGNLLAINEQSLIAIAQDGSIAWSIYSDDYINSITQLRDGSIVVMTYGTGDGELLPIDFETKQFGEGKAVPAGAWSMFPGDEDHDFYYTSGLYLYGFNFGDKEPERILNWMSCDINGEMLDSSGLNMCSDGTIMGVAYDYSSDSSSSQIFTLTKVPADSLPKKQILTVAQLEYNPDYQLTNRMVRFNRSHDNIRLEYKDYNEYNTPDDLTAGMTKFMTEIMAGSLPDILPTNQLPYRQLASKGLLEDLYPYIDTDSDLKREDFFANLLQAMEVNGGLYQVVSGFSVETLVGAASIVGDTPGWTYDEFYEALAKMPDGCTPLDPYVTRDQVLSSLLYADMDSYVDWSSGKVDFENDSFKQLLEFANQFPEEYNWEEHDISESTQDLIRQGRQMLAQTYLYGLDAVLWNDVNFGGKSTYIGWPTTNGVGSIMRFENGFAISKNCSDKDAAWEFLRSMLTEEGQADIYTIPSNRNVFDKKLKELMTPNYRKDSDGNYLLDENGEKIQESRGVWTNETGEIHEVYAMTQEQADGVLEVIDTCTKIASYDTSIFDIVNEQAQAYFAGQKSLDEVARLIQSKANIYVNEQR